MLGNDIVDLQLADKQSNWQRKGFLEKIFTLSEQLIILESENPNQAVWQLWSMKEAAYKIVNRQTLKCFFSPLKFECSFHQMDGLVSFKCEKIYTKSNLQAKFIHTIATLNELYFTQIQTQFLPNKVDYITDFNANSKQYILTKDSNGIPNLIDKRYGKIRSASISHHGAYLAIIF